MKPLLAMLLLITATPAQAFQCRIPPAQFDHEPARGAHHHGLRHVRS